MIKVSLRQTHFQVVEERVVLPELKCIQH